MTRLLPAENYGELDDISCTKEVRRKVGRNRDGGIPLLGDRSARIETLLPVATSFCEHVYGSVFLH